MVGLKYQYHALCFSENERERVTTILATGKVTMDKFCLNSESSLIKPFHPESVKMPTLSTIITLMILKISHLFSASCQGSGRFTSD